MDEQDEYHWIEAARRGNPRAFAVLAEHYWPSIHRWLWGLTGSAHAADDLTQETFLKAWQMIARTRPDTNLRAWLYRIARNSFFDSHRKRQDGQLGNSLEGQPGRERNPADSLLDAEADELLQHACERLPVGLRAAFLLRAQEGLSFCEIGIALGVAADTARWRVFKARRMLLKQLGPWLEREEQDS